MITVITFYTPEYTNEMKEWEKTCKEFLKFPYKAYPVKSKGNWTHNCTMKAEVILQALDEFKTGIVWTDADARFRAYPKVFEELHNYDFGCYWIPNVWNQPRNAHLKPWSRGNEALNGSTLYFNNNKKSKQLLYDWKTESEQNLNRWEQQSLQKVWEFHDNVGLKTYNFNQGYAKVFDVKWFEGEYPLVIEQMQASRKLKNKVK
jgi:hypothetical protein